MMSQKLFIFFFVYVLLILPQTVSAGYVQMAEQKVTANTNSVATGTFSSATTTGNLIVCWLYYNSSTQSVSSLADTAGNTYQSAIGPTTGTSTLAAWRQEIWYAYNITGASNLNVTATMSGTFNASKGISCHEYSGIVKTSDPKDVTGGRAQTSTANASTGSVTTTQANELVFAAGIFGGSGPTNGSGFVNRSNLGSNVAEEKLATSAGSVNATFTNNAQDAITQVVTFKTRSVFGTGINVIQTTKASNPAAAGTIAATLSGVAAGNFVVLALVGNSAVSISSISDGTNSYTLTPNSPSTNASSGGRAWIAYRANVTGGNTTVTVTFNSSAYAGAVMWMAEVSGVAKTSPLDADVAHSATTSSTNINDPSVTTTMSGDLLVGVAWPANTIISVNLPWTGTGDIVYGDAWGYYVQANKGAASVSFTADIASQWAAMIAAFKPASRANPAATNNPLSY